MNTHPIRIKHHVARRAALAVAGLALALPAAGVAVGLVSPSVASAAQLESQTFTFNDTTQYFTVPAGVTSLTLYGAGGAGGFGGGYSILAKGVVITETVPVTPGDTLVIMVGGQGGTAYGNAGGAGGLSSGDGMNGGAGASTNAVVDGFGGGGGGGGTEVVDATDNQVLLVASGAGGAGGDASYGGGSGSGGNAPLTGHPGSGPYGPGGDGGAAAADNALAGADGGTPQPDTLSGGGGGGGGGYYVSGVAGGGGNGGAGGGWTSYESGGGGGGGGDYFVSSLATNLTLANNSSGAGQVQVSWLDAPLPTVSDLVLDPGTVPAGRSYTVTDYVTSSLSTPPTGTVQFMSDGAVVGSATLAPEQFSPGDAPTATAVATFTATAPAAGNVTWQAKYLGDNGPGGYPGDAASSSQEATETVIDPATVTALAPKSGPTSGGTTVTISGTGFTGATKVVFGTVAAKSFTVVSSTEITAVSPAQAAATKNIEVTTPGGTSAPVPADQFTY